MAERRELGNSRKGDVRSQLTVDIVSFCIEGFHKCIKVVNRGEV